MKTLLVILGVMLTSPFSLANFPPLLETALKKTDRPDYRYLAYTLEAAAQEGVTIENYNPDKDDDIKWTLIQVNGQPPTEDDLKKHYEQRRKELERRNVPEDQTDYDGRLKLKEMIRANSLQVISEDEYRIVYSFSPKIGNDQDNIFMEFAKGKISVIKESETVDFIQLYSDDEFSPAFSVQITKFDMTMKFKYHSDLRLCLLDRVSRIVQGRALLFKKIDQDMIQQYSNYRKTD